MARARWQLDSQRSQGSRIRGAARDRRAPAPGVSQAPRVRAQTLGAAVIVIGTQRLDPSADTMFAVLLRVLYSPGLRVGREAVLQCVWPGEPEKRQRANLRQALYKLRGLGVAVGLEGDVVTLDGAQVTPAFATSRTSERFEQDVTLGHEPFGLFLGGYTTGWPEYDEWLSQLRDTIHADVRRVLVEQLRGRRSRADWMGADALARWLLQFDPLNEEATLTHAECTAMNGSKAEAVAILDRFLIELGPDAGDLRLQATLLRRRISEPQGRGRVSFAPSERHFIGREELMAELTMAMRRAKWHDGSATLLHGPPGMGKTRVTQELAKVAVLEGFRVVTVSCRESDQQRPLSVFLDLVPELLEMPGAMGCAPESMGVLRRLTPDIGDRGVPIEHTTDVGSSANSLEMGIPSPQRLRRALLELIASLCYESPLLFAIDDLQWIDDRSMHLLRELCLCSASSRLFVLASGRDAKIATRLNSGAACVRAKQLEPLEPTTSVRLAEAICADFSAEPDDQLKDWFGVACEGTPLFLRSLVSHWIETGVAGGVPPTLGQIIEQRIHSLSKNALRVAQIATMLGRRATPSIVSAVLNTSVAETLSALDELQAVGAFSAGDGELIAFHELFARTATQLLSGYSRRLIHARIASELQSVTGLPDDSLGTDVVAHLIGAAQRDELGRFAVGAAASLLKRGFPHQALAICEAATGYVAPSGAEIALAQLRLQALYFAGHHVKLLAMLPGALTNCSADLTFLRHHADELITLLDAARHSETLEDYAEFSAQATLLAESLALSPEQRVSAARVALRSSSNINIPAIPERALAAGLSAAALCSNPLLAEAELNMYFHSSFGDQKQAAGAALWLRDHLHCYENQTLRILMQADIGFALRITGCVTDARSLYIRTFAEADAAQMHNHAANIAWNLSLLDFDWPSHESDASSWLKQALSHCVSDDQQRCRTLVNQNLVRLEIARGDAIAAATQLQSMLATTPQSTVPIRTAYPLAMQLGTAVLQKDIENVSLLLENARQIYDVTRGMTGQDFLTHQILEALLLLGQDSEAELLLRAYKINWRRSGAGLPHYLSNIERRLAKHHSGNVD